ncbi:MAG TPA: hypothetical protein VLA68_03160 [Nitrososphaera sp.]|nr:hypothetical protein [Nitrososphaera sp.]
MTSSYAVFPVHETIDLRDVSDIRRAVDKMVEAYARQGIDGNFSYRLLLPRGEGQTGKAKRIGIAFQGEFILGLRRKNMMPNIREVRYLHDENHYGWLLANPNVFERFENRI